MRPTLLAWLVTLAGGLAVGQSADAPSFEAASIKATSRATTGVRCSGGPGTTDPGTWSCSDVLLAFLISQPYGYQPPQFTPVDRCCQARFDITAKVPAGTSEKQFHRMQQNLLVEGLKLSFHHEQKEMTVYELIVGEKGSKINGSAPDAALAPEDPWTGPKYIMGKDGYPVFPAGHGGLVGGSGYYRWTAVNVSMPEIIKTLALYLGRPIVDATGLKGKYDINLTWVIDISEVTASLAAQGAFRGHDVPRVAGPDSGPTLQRAVQDQLGLKVNSKKGVGDIVVVDHAEKVPVEN